MKKKWYPTWYAKTVLKIDLNTLKEMGIKHILCDLDNTLVGHGFPFPTAIEIEWVNKVLEKGFTFKVLSNNTEQRVKLFCDKLNVPYLADAYKPFTKRTKKAFFKDKTNPLEWVMIGDQTMTDIRLANKLKIRSILVEPLTKKDIARTYLIRKIDKILRKKILKNLDKINIEKEKENE